MSARPIDLQLVPEQQRKFISELQLLLNQSTHGLQRLPSPYINDLKSRIGSYSQQVIQYFNDLRRDSPESFDAKRELFLNHILRSPENTLEERQAWRAKLSSEQELKAKEEADRKLSLERQVKEQEEKARSEVLLQRNLQIQREEQDRQAEAKAKAEHEARCAQAKAYRDHQHALIAKCGF